MTSSNENIFRVTGLLWGEFTGHRWIPLTKPVTRSFDVYFDLCLNKRLPKQSRCLWFETPSRSSRRHCNETNQASVIWKIVSVVVVVRRRHAMLMCGCVSIFFSLQSFSFISARHKGYRQAHHSDVIIGAIASQITSILIVCSTVSSGADQRKHQSSVSLAFVRGIQRWPVNSPHKEPVTRKMFPFDDAIMISSQRPASRPVREKT